MASTLDESIYKINMDGTFFEAGIGIRFVVRNQWLRRFPELSILGRWNALTFLKALQFAKNFGVSHSFWNLSM
ncbi:unnamed protein product [Coffea canephora]|uniref:Uncharacterized protein n=1 Tax=Coffea canephora TaxID=49390 RepID=A0A068UGK4_COFCA|nr:unnamed protein product [Coffea canephora]